MSNKKNNVTKLISKKRDSLECGFGGEIVWEEVHDDGMYVALIRVEVKIGNTVERFFLLHSDGDEEDS